jgi:DNA-binding CsgD family transcriptional regulator
MNLAPDWGRSANHGAARLIRLTDAQVAQARVWRSSGVSAAEIARRLGCSQGHVEKIVSYRRRWRTYPPPGTGD